VRNVVASSDVFAAVNAALVVAGAAMITPSDVLKVSALPVAACPFRVGRRHNRTTLDVRKGSIADLTTDFRYVWEF
jgi:hypothetical protein